MITLNTLTHYSKQVYFREISPILIVIFFISLSGAGSGGFLPIFFSFLFVIGLPYAIYKIIKINNISFVVNENSITKNYGVLTKRSNTLTFDKIQNINGVTSMFSSLFNLTKLNIWTASPSQTVISKGSSQNNPDIVLTLSLTDAEWIKNFILNKNIKPSTPSPLNQEAIN